MKPRINSTAKVLYDFHAPGEPKISVRKGEIVTVLGEPVINDKWILVEKHSSNSRQPLRGYIPYAYIVETSLANTSATSYQQQQQQQQKSSQDLISFSPIHSPKADSDSGSNGSHSNIGNTNPFSSLGTTTTTTSSPTLASNKNQNRHARIEDVMDPFFAAEIAESKAWKSSFNDDASSVSSYSSSYSVSSNTSSGSNHTNTNAAAGTKTTSSWDEFDDEEFAIIRNYHNRDDSAAQNSVLQQNGTAATATTTTATTTATTTSKASSANMSHQFYVYTNPLTASAQQQHQPLLIQQQQQQQQRVSPAQVQTAPAGASPKIGSPHFATQVSAPLQAPATSSPSFSSSSTTTSSTTKKAVPPPVPARKQAAPSTITITTTTAFSVPPLTAPANQVDYFPPAGVTPNNSSKMIPQAVAPRRSPAVQAKPPPPPPPSPSQQQKLPPGAPAQQQIAPGLQSPVMPQRAAPTSPRSSMASGTLQPTAGANDASGPSSTGGLSPRSHRSLPPKPINAVSSASEMDRQFEHMHLQQHQQPSQQPSQPVPQRRPMPPPPSTVLQFSQPINATPIVVASTTAQQQQTTSTSQRTARLPPPPPLQPIPREQTDQQANAGCDNLLNVVVGTWNVGSKQPHSDAIYSQVAEWIHANELEADIIAVGFQEIEMSGKAMALEETDVRFVWENVLKRTLATYMKSRYVLVYAQQLVGIFMCVFVKEIHTGHLLDLRRYSEKVGTYGLTGNKGGVAVRFDLYGTSFCFMNMHLSAHMDGVAKRNQNAHDILRKTTFGGTINNTEQILHNGGLAHNGNGISIELSDDGYHHLDDDDTVNRALNSNAQNNFVTVDISGKVVSDDSAVAYFKPSPSSNATVMTTNTTTVTTGNNTLSGADRSSKSKDPTAYLPTNHNVLFLFGDLNYRISDLAYSVAIEKIKNGRLAFLRHLDQLSKEMRAGRVFPGFNEGLLDFDPTYKYETDSNEYATEKKRVPSWTDRILWKLSDRNQFVKQTFYGRHEILLSDHRPVSAVFITKVAMRPQQSQP